VEQNRIDGNDAVTEDTKVTFSQRPPAGGLAVTDLNFR